MKTLKLLWKQTEFIKNYPLYYIQSPFNEEIILKIEWKFDNEI